MSYFKELKHLARVLCLMLVWQHKDDLYSIVQSFVLMLCLIGVLIYLLSQANTKSGCTVQQQISQYNYAYLRVYGNLPKQLEGGI